MYNVPFQRTGTVGFRKFPLIILNNSYIYMESMGTYHLGLINNKALPWSIDFLLYYEDKIDEEMLWLNSDVWEKAFEPFVDEEVIEKVVRLL